MNLELITLQDFEKFKSELLSEIKLLLQTEVPKEKDSKWIKGVEVKQLLDCSETKLQRLRIKNGIVYKKIGGIYYYKLQD